MALHSLFSSSSSSFSPSSSSFTYAFSYDVFLSFRGTDTRFDFTSNLHKALSDKGIHTFIDNKELKGGDKITPTLIKAIQESRIAILIFSVNYASSSFCLDELVTIIESVQANGRLVLPVFYDVDPSHVRHQRGTYAKALAKHEERFKEKLEENMERLQNWKAALNQAANLSGFHFKPGNEYEHELIGKIVDQVSNRLSRIPLHVADYPVGLEYRVLEVMSLLDVGCDDGVHLIGIYGIGGIGKTTLALAIYNLIADQFEGLCFLHSVRGNSAKHGLEHLQEMILSKTLGLNIKLGGIHEGISIIKQRLNRKKVLLILDDVDRLEQLRSLVGEPNWFGSGSRVIITTRDKHLLASHRVERKYMAYGLNTKESLELLSWNAFRNDEIDPCYENVLNQAVTYASGLPLALEVLGSNLCGKSIEKWESAIERYKRIPDMKIQNILEISYDDLEEEERSVFLDIACCFDGYGFAEVLEILHAHYGVCMIHHIGVLVEKSLIKIRHWWGMSGSVTLHDLIEDMGKEIVRRESPKKLGSRSRLWFHEDIVQVLEENTGSNEIEMIHLDFPLVEEVDWDGEAFKKMESLKTLIIKKCTFSEGPRYLPNSLRMLEWWYYPSEHFPYDFRPKKLSICKLPHNCFTSLEFPRSSKQFVNLKTLKFDYSEFLREIGDVSSLPNLQEFSFKGCVNLITIHDSVGLLNKLKILDAKCCEKLMSFPPLKLVSLEVLELSNCSSLKIFPEVLKKMENIVSLDLCGTNITEFPSSFPKLTGLRRLYASRWLLRRSFGMMPQVSYLYISREGSVLKIEDEEGEENVLLSSDVMYLEFSNCRLSDELLAVVLPWFPHLKALDLSESKFTIVPECIKQCSFLWKLNLDGCKQLQEIEGVPPSLIELTARECDSLSFSSRSMLQQQELYEAGNRQFSFPSLETPRVPEWFDHKRRGSSPSISFWFRNKFPRGLLLCIVCPPHLSGMDYGVYLTFDDGVRFSYGYTGSIKYVGLHNDGDLLRLWLGHTHIHDMIPDSFAWDLDNAILTNRWIGVEVELKKVKYYIGGEPAFDPEEKVSADIGIHVLKVKTNMDYIRFTNPYNETKFNSNLQLLPAENDVNTNLQLSNTDSDVEEEDSDVDEEDSDVEEEEADE